MLDVIMLALVAVFFGMAWAFAGLCDRLLSTETPGEELDV